MAKGVYKRKRKYTKRNITKGGPDYHIRQLIISLNRQITQLKRIQRTFI